MYDPVDVSENFSLKKASGLKRGCGPPPDQPLSNSNTCGFDQYFDFNEHVKMTCEIVFFRICGIAEIRRYLSHDTAKTIVHAYITSRLDYSETCIKGTPSGNAVASA